MAARRMWVTLGTATVLAGMMAGRTVQASPRGLSSSGDATIVGCVAQTDGGFFLTTTGADAGRRSGGSSSAKASTPIRGGHPAPAQRTSGGSNSAKASTPIGAAPSGTTGQRTGGVTTAKGSVPIPRTALSQIVYQLDSDPDQLSPHAGHVVEVSGTIVTLRSPAPARTLKVAYLKLLSASCPQ